MSRFKVPSAVFIIFKRNDHVLLAQRRNTGHEDGNFGLVAGHIDAGETALQAAIREAHEEVGVRLDRCDLHLIHMQHYNLLYEAVYIDWFFEVTRWNGELSVMEPGKCGEMRWCGLSTLPVNTIGYIVYALEEIYTHGRNYSEWGWELRNPNAEN